MTELIERSRTAIAALERDIRTKTGPALFDFLLEAFEEHKRALGDPLSLQAIMAGMEATWWLNDTLHEWLGEIDRPHREAPSVKARGYAETGTLTRTWYAWTAASSSSRHRPVARSKRCLSRGRRRRAARRGCRSDRATTPAHRRTDRGC